MLSCDLAPLRSSGGRRLLGRYRRLLCSGGRVLWVQPEEPRVLDGTPSFDRWRVAFYATLPGQPSISHQRFFRFPSVACIVQFSDFFFVFCALAPATASIGSSSVHMWISEQLGAVCYVTTNVVRRTVDRKATRVHCVAALHVNGEG